VNANQKILAAVGVGIMAALFWLAWQGDNATVAALGTAGADWGRPRRYGEDFDWLGAVLPTPHPIYRQTQPGHCRTRVMQYGWGWVTDPPSEEGL
jgi:hypothetical protein